MLLSVILRVTELVSVCWVRPTRIALNYILLLVIYRSSRSALFSIVRIYLCQGNSV
jgi:hypothetical protein